MTATRSTLVAGVYRLAQVEDAPEPDGIPMQTVFEVLADFEDAMLRDVDLSDQNRRVAKFDKRLSGSQTFALPVQDGSPSYAFLQTDPNQSFWYPVEIVNHSSLNEQSWNGRLAVAFYGTPAIGEVSWIPEAGQTLRVWYDRSKDIAPTMSGSADINSLYESYLKACAAAQVRELAGKDVGIVLMGRIQEGREQWKRFARSSRQQGSIEKPLGFSPRNQRRRYNGLDPTRFFIP